MAKVYVAGALIPTGGAYMAYHIGRLLARHFGYELVDINIYDPGAMIFHYDTPMRTVTVQEMERNITHDDLLIVNPAFSQFLFGLRLPGRKIMYVQDFRTFLLLDCHFDMYVSVSRLVSRYIYALYGISSGIIPPFIDTGAAQSPNPWSERPEGSAMVYIKNPSRDHHMLLQFLQHHLKRTAPHIDLSNVVEGRKYSHADFLNELGKVRYFVNLSMAEGFGLVPLEAMAMGTLVTGVDGLAGRDYMRQGRNSMTGSIRDLRTLPGIVQRAFEDDQLAAACVEGGLRTAPMFDYAAFKQAWLREFALFLGREPEHD